MEEDSPDSLSLTLGSTCSSRKGHGFCLELCHLPTACPDTEALTVPTVLGC